jgi:hypothetical protein
VGDGEASDAAGLGRERAEREAPRGTEVTAALMEGGGFLCTRVRVWSAPFIGKQGEKGGHNEQSLGLRELRGGMNRSGSAATEPPASSAGIARTPWRAGKTPTGGG